MAIFFWGCSGFSFLFSLLLLVQNVHGFALAGAAAGIVFSSLLLYAYIRFVRTKSYRSLSVMRKLFEYWPFVMIACFVCSRALVAQSPVVLDAVLAVFWFIIVLLKQGIVYYTKDKRIAKYFPQTEAVQTKKKSLITELVEWIDAAFYAVFFVLLVNIFIFQVYRIPSESMVPEFMIGDTVIGFKTASGPAFPLSSFRLPQWKTYKRGDIVILSNPNYPDTPKARLKTFLSQLVYMLTLAQVNINTDDYGKPKADPLVKRITGMPGEKLMMVDGVLYAKHRDDSEFMPVEDDRLYANWDLTLLPQSEQRLIKDIKINADELRMLEAVEAQRKALDFTDALQQAEALVGRAALLKDNKDTATAAADFVQPAEYEMLSLFSANDTLSRRIMTTNGGIDWLRSFMTGWVPYWQSDNAQHASLYEKRFAQFNALMKLCFGKLMVRNIELFQANATAEQFVSDAERNRLLQEAQTYAFYLAWTGQRNMNVFPAGTEYIPDDHYFMMGDNRFNSTDMRHAYFFRLEPVDKNDPLSIRFQSNSEPKYVAAQKILGTTVLRVFPFSRFGAL